MAGISRGLTLLPASFKALGASRFSPTQVEWLNRTREAGFGAFRAEWLRRHALRNLAVEILLPDGGTVRGVVAGVDELGALLLECDGRRRRFVSGEVSVRRAHR